jgi:hypothetical protein
VPRGRRGDPSHMRRVNFVELRKGEVRSAPSPRPGGPNLGGAIIQAGIISVLCMWGYVPSVLYIRILPHRGGAMHRTSENPPSRHFGE